MVHYARNRTISHRWLPATACVAQGTSTGIPVPTFTTSFWVHDAALQQRRGSRLTSNTWWAIALSWPHPSFEFSGLSTVLVEVHLWRSPFPSPSLAPKPPPPMQHSTGHPKPQTITTERSQVTSSFLFSQRLLVWKCIYQHEGGLHKPVPQESNAASRVLQYMFSY